MVFGGVEIKVAFIIPADVEISVSSVLVPVIWVVLAIVAVVKS